MTSENIFQKNLDFGVLMMNKMVSHVMISKLNSVVLNTRRVIPYHAIQVLDMHGPNGHHVIHRLMVQVTGKQFRILVKRTFALHQLPLKLSTFLEVLDLMILLILMLQRVSGV